MTYVVFDPTGRDQLDCMEVGRVVRTEWEDGEAVHTVKLNSTGELMSVTSVHAVLPSDPGCDTMRASRTGTCEP